MDGTFGTHEGDIKNTYISLEHLIIRDHLRATSVVARKMLK
jgi:hypothetical protein